MSTTTVLRVITRMNVGGPAQQLTGLLAGIDRERFDQVLAIGAPEDEEEDWIGLRAPWLSDDPRIVRLPGLRRSIRPRADNAAYRQLRSLIRHVRPDIVHTHTTKAGLVGRLAGLRERVPGLVHTFHGHLLRGYAGPVQNTGLRIIERQLAARTDVLMSVGAQVRDDLLEAGIGERSKYVVVPPGVSPPAEHDPAAAREMLGLPHDRPVVAWVARITHIKRPDRLIEVAERVERELPGAVFIVAGGTEDGQLSQLRAAVDKADVRFLGWVADVGMIYSAADLVLLTSDMEGTPVSLIEAGMCGRACVASDVGSVSEVVLDGRTGRVVPAEARALTGAVVELLNDDERRELYGSAARRHTHAAFSMERLVQTTEEVYDAVLGRGALPATGPSESGGR